MSEGEKSCEAVEREAGSDSSMNSSPSEAYSSSSGARLSFAVSGNVGIGSARGLSGDAEMLSEFSYSVSIMFRRMVCSNFSGRTMGIVSRKAN